MTSPLDVTLPLRVPGAPQYAAWYTPTLDGREARAAGRPPIKLDTGNTPVTVGVVPQLLTAVTRVVPPPVVVDPGSGDTFVDGVTRPTRLNVGAYDYDAMVTHTGSYTFAGAGTQANPIIVRDRWFTLKVSITGQWYRFINCHFSGGFAINETPLQCTNVGGRNNVLYRCTIWPQNPRSDTPSTRGHNLRYDRVYVRNCTDGMAHIGIGRKADGSLANDGDYTGIDQAYGARNSLFELAVYRSPDYGGAGKLPDNASHLDLGAQLRGGDNFDFFNCDFRAFIDPSFGEGGKASVDMPLSGTHVTGKRVTHTGLYTLSIFMFSPNLGTIRNFRVDSCWMDGGTEMFVLAERVSGITITNNRMGRLHRSSPGLVSVRVPDGDVGVVVAGNHYWYELGPNGEKWPYNQQPLAEAGETMPPASIITKWAAAKIQPDDEATWPAANTRSKGG